MYNTHHIYVLFFIKHYNKRKHPHSHTHSHTPHTHHIHTHTLTPTHTHTKTHTQSHLSTIVNCVDTNSTQFNVFNVDFISI